MNSDDPFANSGDNDRTVIRPTPGRRNTTPVTPQQNVPLAPGAPQSITPQTGVGIPPSAAFAQPQQFAPATAAITASGLNPLVDSAVVLLTLAAQLRNTPSHPDVAGLREHVMQQIRIFEQNSRSAGVTPETALTARYTLCTLLDETVLGTPWGSESVWSTQSLLSTFHKETWGGEKFFMILDRMMQEPTSNIDMLELMYICLSLGFEGKYAVLEQGRSKLTETMDNLFRTIRMQRGDFERELSPHWRGVQDKRNVLVRYVPLWVVGALAGVLLLVTYGGFRFILENSSSSAYDTLETIGQVTGGPEQQ